MDMNPKSLRIVFAGTPPFAATILEALVDANYSVIGVYTQPDRPAGRGRKLQASAVKTLALARGLPVFQPASLKDPQVQQELQDLQADLLIVVAYGLILPLPVLAASKMGAINVHPSLLPRWRGAAPIQRCLLAGDDVTGITIMEIEEGLDSGPVLFEKYCPVLKHDTSETLHERLAALGAETLLEAMPLLVGGQLFPNPQSDVGVTYATKLEKSEAALDWSDDEVTLDRKIRAFNPWPVAHTQLGDQLVRIWNAIPLAARQEDDSIAPGTILAANQSGLDVATGHRGILRLQVVQLPGGRELAVADLINAQNPLFKKGQLFTRVVKDE